MLKFGGLAHVAAAAEASLGVLVEGELPAVAGGVVNGLRGGAAGPEEDATPEVDLGCVFRRSMVREGVGSFFRLLACFLKKCILRALN